MNVRIGVDVGGTKIEALALRDDGSESERIRVATPAGDYDATIRAIAALVTRVELGEGGRSVVGLGHPGSRCPLTGLHRNANSTCLNGRALVDDLARAIGRPLRAANDANCFALSEACDGAGAGHRVVFGVILGTGVGGGVVVDRRVLDGANGIAGEWGHMPLPGESDEERASRPCYCGSRGCLEMFCAGPAVERECAQRTGRALSLAEIARLAESQPGPERRAIDRLIARLASALATVAQVLDPDVIVLGGGVSRIDRLAHALPAAIEPLVFGRSFKTPIRHAVHGDSGGVRGAAWLWTLDEARAAGE
ncbi:MAG: ROK family protein [Planctomycetota bacterium]|nr:ROK family protein [Planctomycetota bacterium]MDA1106012.1 ROK family protein [Planctomycetota bacterium]